MNKIVYKFLLARDKFMPELHLKQPRDLLIVLVNHLHRERIQKFKETGHSNHIYQNELDKSRFARDGPYSDSKAINGSDSDKQMGT